MVRINTDSPTTLVTPVQAGKILGVSKYTLRDWRRTGRGPRYVRLGQPNGRIRYSTAELSRWVHGQEYDSTSAESAAVARSGSK